MSLLGPCLRFFHPSNTLTGLWGPPHARPADFSCGLGTASWKISARADGGPRSPSAHAWRSARPPIDTSGNFSAHMSGGGISKFVLGFRNFRYDFWGVGGDVWRWLCRHVRRKISAHVDGGTSERSSVRRRWARTPIGASGIPIVNATLWSCLALDLELVQEWHTTKKWTKSSKNGYNPIV